MFRKISYVLTALVVAGFSSVSSASKSYCYNLYMTSNQNDPGTFCVSYPSRIIQGATVMISLYGYTNLEKYLIESFPAIIGSGNTLNNTGDPSFTTFPIEGQGNLYSIKLNQLVGSGSPSFGSVLIKNLADGHAQDTIVDNADGTTGHPPGYYCKQHCH